MTPRTPRDESNDQPEPETASGHENTPESPEDGNPDAVGRWGDVIARLPRSPWQERAKRTVAALLDAAEEAVAEHGIERFTTSDVARLSGLSIGAVYTYFDDRVAILDAIRPHRFDADQTLTHIRDQLENLRARTADTLSPEDQGFLDEVIALTHATSTSGQEPGTAHP